MDKKIFKPLLYYWKIERPTLGFSLTCNSMSVAIYKLCIGLGWFWFPETDLRTKEPLD